MYLSWFFERSLRKKKCYVLFGAKEKFAVRMTPIWKKYKKRITDFNES